LLGAWGVYVAFGMLITLNGALVPLVREDLDLSRSQMGLILGAWQFVYILTAIPSGRFIDWIGVRRALMVSAVIMLGSAVLRTTATGFWSLLIPVGLFGVGAPIISIGAPKVAASLFEGSDRRRAVGIYGTAPAIGGVLALSLSTNLIGPLVDDNWRTITLIMTGIAGFGLIVWIVVSRGLDAVIEPGGGPLIGEYLGLAKTPVVTFILGLAVLNFFAAHGISQWLVAMLTETGWSAEASALWAAAGTVVGLAATFLIPRFATVARRRSLMIVILLLGSVGVVSLLTTNPLVLALAVGASAIPRVAIMPILVMVMMDHRDVGPGHIAAASGLFFSLSQIGGVAGPAITGAMADATGDFQAPLFMQAGVMVTIALVLALGFNKAVGEPES
jgi:CP family cyanate transporter-like MFS transporter